MKKNTAPLTKEQKAKLIAAFLLIKKEKSSTANKEKVTPWKTLLGFRNV